MSAGVSFCHRRRRGLGIPPKWRSFWGIQVPIGDGSLRSCPFETPSYRIRVMALLTSCLTYGPSLALVCRPNDREGRAILWHYKLVSRIKADHTSTIRVAYDVQLSGVERPSSFDPYYGCVILSGIRALAAPNLVSEVSHRADDVSALGPQVISVLPNMTVMYCSI